ncbi:MAG: hypothetical protein GY915_03180 [bacterium]|nr:hypothetical protein [bacterium]
MFKKYLTLMVLVPLFGISPVKASSFDEEDSSRPPLLSRHTSLGSNLMGKVYDLLKEDPKTGKKMSRKEFNRLTRSARALEVGELLGKYQGNIPTGIRLITTSLDEEADRVTPTKKRSKVSRFFKKVYGGVKSFMRGVAHLLEEAKPIFKSIATIATTVAGALAAILPLILVAL